MNLVSHGSKSSGEESSESSSGNDKSQSENTVISTITTESILNIDRSVVDWNYIQTEMEKISNSWSIMTIDLNSINVDSNNILTFNEIIDTSLNYIKNKDKQNALISIANLYSYIPKYKDEYSTNKQEKEIAYVKSDLISSYALIDANQWTNINEFLKDADIRITSILNSADNTENKQNIEKTYVLLKDYIKSCNDKNVDLCYMKYYYLIQEVKKI